ncbi:hypothetical protein [Tahibacter sp.]|uniref:hypothetical protein n=1 Tax=Tahibacter sp. TaxID=2056211 RepID=UPI0028C3ABC3|nr:hypothetical protein [Tahibacter sp.]
MGSPDLSAPSAWSSPLRWYLAALVPIWTGYFMYKTEASEQERLRLHDPVPAVGEFVSAECVRPRKRSYQEYWLTTTYAFVAAGYVSYEEQASPGSRPAPTFTAVDWVWYPSLAECEAARSAVRSAKAPHPVWFEKGQPHSSKTTLEEPDSTRFLWLGLGAVPLVLIGGILALRRRRRSA